MSKKKHTHFDKSLLSCIK